MLDHTNPWTEPEGALHDEAPMPADLRVAYLGERTWQVAPSSERGRALVAVYAVYEIHQEIRPLDTGIFLDLPEVNRIAASARKRGFVIEFSGRNEVMFL
jgi:hypothetical protein